VRGLVVGRVIEALFDLLGVLALAVAALLGLGVGHWHLARGVLAAGLVLLVASWLLGRASVPPARGDEA